MHVLIDTSDLHVLSRQEQKARTQGTGLRRDFDHTADVSHLGLAWATVEPRPDPGPLFNVSLDQSAADTPGGYVGNWTATAKTQEELLAALPWKNPVEARKAVVQWINGLTSQIESLYPSSVQKRWLIEEAAARAVAADDGSATQDQIDMMTNEGAAKGRTMLEHANAVIQNADRFRSIVDETNKLFLATDARLQAAASPLEYSVIFEWAQAQAAPLAAAYGLTVETDA